MAYVTPICDSEITDKFRIPLKMFHSFFSPRLTPEHRKMLESSIPVEVPASDGDTVPNFVFQFCRVNVIGDYDYQLAGDWCHFVRNRRIVSGDMVEFKWCDEPEFRLRLRIYRDGVVPPCNHEEEIASLRSKVRVLEKECKDFQELKPKQTKTITDLLIAVSKFERRDIRMKIRQESQRLGKLGVTREGISISMKWEDGQAFKEINTRLRHLLEEKEAVESQQKLLRERISDMSDEGDMQSGNQEEDSLIEDEVYQSRLLRIKREEEELLRERDKYELEKGMLLRQMKQICDEDGSRFNNFPILNSRYALLNLLGKGGFSEVYKAYDLVDHRYVACKLHGLNPQWNEEKQRSYIRHACREYEIHKTLVHDNIVRLWDTFKIDDNTFCTVLEFCSGKDLDAVLKATPVLSEKEARIIIVQIFQGLVYLNKRTQKVIHYDLKPGNVLFDELGVAKLTDFGLSKLVEEDVGPQGMELTSQGAGTYWYLPPECFELTKIPLISSKVDVWSAGVLFYQMLFGRRPFGHDQSQEQILREGTILNAREVDFPANPSVSTEAKDVIRRCLTYNQAERADVFSIARDPYFHIPRNER